MPEEAEVEVILQVEVEPTGAATEDPIILRAVREQRVPEVAAVAAVRIIRVAVREVPES
jgi:hypothetical protein